MTVSVNGGEEMPASELSAETLAQELHKGGEDPSGQTSLATGDPVMLSTKVVATRPERAELIVGGFRVPVNRDHNPGELLYLHVVVELGDVTIGPVRKHQASVEGSLIVEPPGGMSPQEALDELANDPGALSS